MPATGTQIATLDRINRQFNLIPYDGLPGPDEGYDVWRDTPEDGESWVCRDYAIAKARALVNGPAAWPRLDLSVVECWTEPVRSPKSPIDPLSAREYHAVLAAKANDDIYILDSRADSIYPWQTPPYSYLWDKQQIPGTLTYRDARSGLV